MTDQERLADGAGDETRDREDWAFDYEPPQLAVMGSLEELTHGVSGSGGDNEMFVFS